MDGSNRLPELREYHHLKKFRKWLMSKYGLKMIIKTFQELETYLYRKRIETGFGMKLSRMLVLLLLKEPTVPAILPQVPDLGRLSWGLHSRY